MALAQIANGAYEFATGVGIVATGAVNSVVWPIGWTLRTVGTGLLYTASTGGKVVTFTAAGVTVGVGYPVAVISAIVAVSSGIFATGPCLEYDNLQNNMPKIRTLWGILELALSPGPPTVQILDASFCPYSLHTFVTSTAISLLSYTIARCARRTFA